MAYLTDSSSQDSSNMSSHSSGMEENVELGKRFRAHLDLTYQQYFHIIQQLEGLAVQVAGEEPPDPPQEPGNGEIE